MKKCGGLPLALKTLGRALRTKTDDDEWEEMLNSEIWDLKDERDIIPAALRLSYYDLPPHLKHLFAYCSLFPKDFMFDKNKLVLRWVAEGFIYQSNSNKSQESLGHQYFEELKSRSFFQSLTSYKPKGIDDTQDIYYANLGSLLQRFLNERPIYIMHDLINDLAKSVAGDFFIRLGDKMDMHDRRETLVNLRHFSFTGSQYGVCRKFMELQRPTCLRTFMTVSIWKKSSEIVLLLPLLRFVRVLKLSNCSLKEVPESIGDLKHLRYLNLSKTAIERLPEQVSNLYNLQSLLVHGCSELSVFPESFIKLTHLRHLDISDTPKLNKMSLGICGMTNLQTLSKVIVEGADGFKISDLKHLSDLRGRLSIKGLDRVIDPTHAKDANLKQKKFLHYLEMEWGNICKSFDGFSIQQSRVLDDSYNEKTELEVLKGLRPHHALRNQEIKFYWGRKFPSWVGHPSFDHLTKLILRGCRSCKHLPTLGHLGSLQILFVEGMNEMETLDSNFLAPKDSVCHVAFSSLEVLSIKNMQAWGRWSTSGDGNNIETGELFPRLREIYIEHCPKLAEVSVDSILSLQVLYIEGCSEVVLRSLAGVSSSILIITLQDVKGLTHLPEEVLKHLGKVGLLDITRCNDLRYLWKSVLEIPSSLKILQIRKCDNLRSFGEERCFVHLTNLSISDCDSLEAIEKGFGFVSLFQLKSLKINNCKNLKSFPHKNLQNLTSLKDLQIRDCPNLDYSFASGLSPPNLSSLMIGCLQNPISDWGLQQLPMSLNKLYLFGKNSGVKSFDFLLPPSLTSLEICEFKDLESLTDVLKHLTCLQNLFIVLCPMLRHLPETTPSLKVSVNSKSQLNAYRIPTLMLTDQGTPFSCS